ncbi:hypothetical protein SAMN02799616_02631 [Paenibacillus sp. UNC499MF]|nr:hypothetical protein SAMN02799616_02631 [Paenibacillus sp. UNC499MF]
MMKLESELKQDQSIKFITWSPDKIQVLYFKMKNAETGVAYLQKVGADAQQIVDIPKPAGFKWNNQGTAFYALESFATGKLGYDKVSATIYKVSDLKQQVAGIRAYPDLLWDESGKNVIFSTFETDKNKKVTAWSSIKVKNIETNSDYKELKNSGSASVYFKLDRVENGGLYYKKINRDDNTSTEEKIPIN